MTASQPLPHASAHIEALRRHNVRLGEVHYFPIDDLKGYRRALRKRSAKGLEALKSSIAAFGMVLPILVDASATIIGGEGLVEAARALGLREVPTLRIDHLSDDEIRLLRIALNKLAETSDWNEIELAAEFGELLSLEVDLDLNVTGFETVEIDNMLLGLSDPETVDPDDEVLPIGEQGSAISRLGDIWDLGEHRVLCGSSLEYDNLARLLAGELARMVLTDSPYGVPINGHVSGLGRHKHREFVQGGKMSEAEFVDFQIRSTTALAKCCVDGGLLYLFMDFRHQWEMMSGIRAAGLALINMAVWIKRSGGMGSLYRSQHELCYIAKKGKAPHKNNVQLGRYGRSRSNAWHYPGVNSFGAGRDELLAMHPTCKNVSMLADAIRDVTDRGDIVLDGFLGSGSTLIAAERTGRRCYGVELDPLYVDTIICRWEKATGRVARLQDTGETITEVADRRQREADRAPPLIVARTRVRAA